MKLWCSSVNTSVSYGALQKYFACNNISGCASCVIIKRSDGLPISPTWNFSNRYGLLIILKCEFECKHNFRTFGEPKNTVSAKNIDTKKTWLDIYIFPASVPLNQPLKRRKIGFLNIHSILMQQNILSLLFITQKCYNLQDCE